MSILPRLRRWLLGDPIRIAPEEGRLLGLAVGRRVIVDDELFIITGREPPTGSAPTTLLYHLQPYVQSSACLPDAPVVLSELDDNVMIQPADDGTSVQMRVTGCSPA